jgi:hypothetical protein
VSSIFECRKDLTVTTAVIDRREKGLNNLDHFIYT